MKILFSKNKMKSKHHEFNLKQIELFNNKN
jgi:hypothetical protein